MYFSDRPRAILLKLNYSKIADLQALTRSIYGVWRCLLSDLPTIEDDRQLLCVLFMS
ncbi:hypothetical protein IQ272_23870 [Chroococcidiopsidales cyanobacterium LEGE 13417]|nr:hypothetical protein [Chroococcidiopsidales cyanobacterium LEGE 13417]